jgi:hypothetical protein
MIQRKACRRCSGDLYLERDVFGSYVTCIQCGFLLDQEATDAMLARMANTSAATNSTPPAEPVKPEEETLARRLFPHRAA